MVKLKKIGLNFKYFKFHEQKSIKEQQLKGKIKDGREAPLKPSRTLVGDYINTIKTTFGFNLDL